MSDKHTLYLVDGASYLYRAFHAMPSLRNSKGEATGAVYGVTNMLRRLLADYQPRHVAVVFDAPGKTFRDDLYPAYKANRPPMPEDLAMQIEPAHAVVRAMGLPLLMIQGVEADDVLGTLARQALDQGMDTVISTGDKDMAQLVGPGITLVNTMDDSILDEAAVRAKFGVPPERIVDFLALVGDTVDNVPGVPKVGPKTAAKWLAAYGSLDAIMAHAAEIGGKVGENLRSSLGHLPLSRELVTIRCDVELPAGPLDLEPAAPDREALVGLYTRLEFKSWLRELLGQAEAAAALEGAAPATPAARYDLVLDEAAFAAWLGRLREAEIIAVDTETTSLDYMRAELVGVSVAVAPGEGAYIPCGHRYLGAPPQLSRETVLEGLRALLEDPAVPKVGQNLKYDTSILARHGVALRGAAHDTMLESYVLDSTGNRHDLDSLALKYLAHRTVTFEEVAGKGVRQLTFDQVDLERAAPYAAEDAEVTLRLHRTLWPRLEAEPALARVYAEIEMPLMPVLSRMERRGVRVDRDMLARQSLELAERIAELEEEACAIAGERFNLGSPKQIQAILYDRMGLPVLARTPKGQPSTAEAVLQELALTYPLAERIMAHRAVSKLKATYTDALPGFVDPATQRVHTSYHQAVAATGRLSSSDPNLQNIPVRTPEGRRIRAAFVADPGFVLMAADYSQIELRIMAHLSGDAGLLAAFAAGEDIHRATAAEVFGIAPGAVSAEQRRRAKAINFGLIYGMSAYGLARQLGIERGEAQTYVDRYFERYPGVREYMDRIREVARDKGYVETVFGRRLHVPDIHASNGQRRQYAERTAINAPMQGTAADIIKRAMIDLDAWLEGAAGDAVRMTMQVHDELVFEVREERVEEMREAIPRRMAAAAALEVPLVVDTGIGGNWDEAH